MPTRNSTNSRLASLFTLFFSFLSLLLLKTVLLFMPQLMFQSVVNLSVSSGTITLTHGQTDSGVIIKMEVCIRHNCVGGGEVCAVGLGECRKLEVLRKECVNDVRMGETPQRYRVVFTSV